jgi:hypothetical protein
MLPIMGVPQTIAKGMESFRTIFCRAEDFEYVCRFITGLVLSPNKTLQGIYDLQVWEGEAPSRRAMHERAGSDHLRRHPQLRLRRATHGLVSDGDFRRVDEVAADLRHQHPESFRDVRVSRRNGEDKVFWAFTKVVRLKRYGRKRLVIVHERADLSDVPRFLVTHALYWESGRMIQTWSYRWASEVFHEFGKQVCGLESAQVRKEEAVTRHFRLSCVAQSLVQRAPAVASKSERYAFAAGKKTYGQKCQVISREVLRSLLALSQRYFAEGKSCDEVLEVLMPA